MHVVAMPDWRVSLKQHHEGYISLEEFFQNQERLEKNRTNGEAMVLSGPAREGLATKDCMSFRCDLLDAAISEEVLQALQPAALELALAALRELESRDQTILRQWQMRLERAEYEAALAERRYQEVDPSQRLVASKIGRASCRERV